MTGSRLDFSFDTRVAVQYDVLRGHPPAVSRAIANTVAREAVPGARLLELGVGTGRIALPVAAAGCEIVGLDLSADMLGALASRLPGFAGAPLWLVRGNVVALPFGARTFDAVMATHVLHLVPDWRAVLGELARVLRPGGLILLGRDWVDPESMPGRIRAAFRQAVIDAGFSTAAPAGGKPLHEALVGIGASPQRIGPAEIVAAEWQAEVTPTQVLDGIRSRDDAESWVLPDEILGPVSKELDRFAATQWPDLSTPRTVRRRFLLASYRLYRSTAGAP
ncbi:MAG: class I SAM-dependent methyltransferase [Steroidobacteraceae bacterium]|jgi:ubiquinone/menaquinone biosynthesis C-methylase UbiE|nr:class I SAM-dependent methyltransferase [Steroidobacteraceae bacterium]